MTHRIGPVEGTPAEGAVLAVVRESGPLSRAQIGRRTGLSSAAVTRAAQPLIDAGFLSQVKASAVKKAQAGMGRPSQPLAVNPLRFGAIGIKVTNDSAVGVVCDLLGEVRASLQRSLDSLQPDRVISELVAMIQALRGEAAREGFSAPITEVGLSFAGEVDSDLGIVRYSPFLEWKDVVVAQPLEQLTGCNVVVENEVKALGVAEGLKNFAYVTLGSSIGCALVVNGNPVQGAFLVAGKLGHLPLGDRALQCTCGGFGCINTEASTISLERLARQVAGKPDLLIDEAAELARSGQHAELAELFTRAGHLIGLGIASLVNLLGPDNVIFGGDETAWLDLMAAPIEEAFASQVYGGAKETDLRLRPVLANEWALGAAVVALERGVFHTRR